MKALVTLLALPLVWLLGLALRLLPRSWALVLGRGLGWGWYRLIPIRRAVARRQVRLALGEPREDVIAGMYAELGMHFVDLVSGRPHPTQIEIDGLGHLKLALESGRGALVLSAHLGPWEALIGAAARAGAPVSVVSRRLSNPWADRLWRRWRAPDVRFLEASGSGRDILRALAAGEVVALVLDQHDPRPRAVPVPFFGRLASTGLDLARLSALSGAPVVPAFIHREGEGARVEVSPPIPAPGRGRAALVEATAHYTALIEEAVRRRPAQWLWIHRRWKYADRAAASTGRAAEAHEVH